ACHGCLLSFETQSEIDHLDRHAALEALTDTLLQALELPEELRFFGDGSELEPLSMKSALHMHVQRAGIQAVRVHLGGPVEDWDWDAWPLRSSLRALADSDVPVTIVVPHASRMNLSWEEANSLASRLEVEGFE